MDPTVSTVTAVVMESNAHISDAMDTHDAVTNTSQKPKTSGLSKKINSHQYKNDR